MENNIYVDILILGINRASMSSAIYCSRAGMSVAVLDKHKEDEVKIIKSNLDFLSIGSNIESLEDKAKESGVLIKRIVDIEKAIFTSDIKIIQTSKEKYIAKAVVITSGNDVERFNIENCEKFMNNGIYYNIVANIEVLNDKLVAIIGNSHSMFEEALYLSKIARKVVIIKGNENIEYSKKILKDIEKNDNITVISGYKLIGAFGFEKLEGIYLNDINSGKRKRLRLDAIIGSFGKNPSVYEKDVSLEHRDDGYIRVNMDMETNISGVFASGAATERVINEIPTDINDSVVAVLNAIKYIKEKTEDNI